MMSKVFLGARYLLGVAYVVFGLNFFLKFIPMTPPAEPAASFLSALFLTGYMFPLVKVIEILCGIAFLANRFVALSAVVIFPITLNIFLIHIFLDPSGFVVGLVMLVLNLLVAWERRASYAPMLQVRS
jgi:putative oxidoreductase